jgi:hypothetical protein
LPVPGLTHEPNGPRCHGRKRRTALNGQENKASAEDSQKSKEGS